VKEAGKMTQTCDKCKNQMKKKQTINAGNSKYEVHECPKCGNKKQVCIGINM